ncbi:acyltransferase [Dokdonella soli]|uniref:Acyltransferase n=1 Tax=Dokdonella soli TaxID=529810 RepID=A0ABN1IB81_9GAMM
MNSILVGEDRRLRHIDALRAIAALLVLWRHVADIYVHADPSGMAGGRWLRAIADSVDVGRIGVIVFFLISGFVIPFSMHAGRPAAVGSFVIKRFFRIYPAYWLSIPLGALTGFWIWGNEFSARDFAINLTLLQNVLGARPAEGLYWTLLAEWTFYALCVVLLLTNSLANMRRVCALAIGLGLAHALAEVTRSLGMPLLDAKVSLACFYLSIMLCGTLYRTCVVDGAARRAPWLRASVYALFAGYLAILPAAGLLMTGAERDAWIPCALGMAVFIGGTSWLRVSTRLTDWLGRISYSIYLFHPVVFMALWWWLLQQPATSWWRTQHLGVYLFVNAALTIVVAACVYRFVEKPSIACGHRIASRWAQYRARRSAQDEGAVFAETVRFVPGNEPAPPAA